MDNIELYKLKIVQNNFYRSVSDYINNYKNSNIFEVIYRYIRLDVSSIKYNGIIILIILFLDIAITNAYIKELKDNNCNYDTERLHKSMYINFILIFIICIYNNKYINTGLYVISIILTIYKTHDIYKLLNKIEKDTKKGVSCGCIDTDLKSLIKALNNISIIILLLVSIYILYLLGIGMYNRLK
tara:strand:- start:14 stop:568 length:555 start_codon:yes stop_codon:yes gene_type:complete